MREGGKRKNRNTDASFGDYGDDVEQNVNRRSGEAAEEERRYSSTRSVAVSLHSAPTRVSALVQEKNVLLAKIKGLEKEASVKPYRGERDKAHDDLRSKLKAAENLCESLMDENEDMKKEVRQLEEEIYELQDNFR